MPSNGRLQSPPARAGSLARGSYNFRKRPLRRSRCEHGVVGFGPWAVRGLYEAPTAEQRAYPPTIGGESPRAIKHPAVKGLDCLRAPITHAPLYVLSTGHMPLAVSATAITSARGSTCDDIPPNAPTTVPRTIPSRPKVLGSASNPSCLSAEVLGFLVVIFVDAHLAGVDSCAGFTGAVFGISASLRVCLDVNESSLEARGGFIDVVHVLCIFFSYEFAVEYTSNKYNPKRNPEPGLPNPEYQNPDGLMMSSSIAEPLGRRYYTRCSAIFVQLKQANFASLPTRGAFSYKKSACRA